MRSSSSDICWNGTFTLGSSVPPPVHPVTSALPVLGDELRATREPLRHGRRRPVRRGGAAPRHRAADAWSPLGQLAWTQKRAPLGLLLQRFEGAPLEQHETVTATGTAVAGASSDWFAPGGFTELSDSEALNRPAFERLQGGVRPRRGGRADLRRRDARRHGRPVPRRSRRRRSPRRPCRGGCSAADRRDGVEACRPAALRRGLGTERRGTVCDPAGGRSRARPVPVAGPPAGQGRRRRRPRGRRPRHGPGLLGPAVTETVDFLGWVRPALGDLVTTVEQGRARAGRQVTLTARSAAGAVTGTESAHAGASCSPAPTTSSGSSPAPSAAASRPRARRGRRDHDVPLRRVRRSGAAVALHARRPTRPPADP